VTLASGLIVALGDGFAVAAGVVFGLAVGVGVSSETAGVLAWNGVDAASCARTNAAAASSTIARTNERM
jgi:hypothetical protein